MKYIKDFNKFDIKELKRFILSFENDVYFIDEIIGVSGVTLTLKMYSIYYVHSKETEVHNNFKIIKINIKYLDNVIYSAYNYEDCNNYLKFLIDADKYNM